MKLAVLSPHLDDAVISAFTTLRAETLVVNVFDRPPPAGTLSLWDRLCGATDSAEWATRRLAEDAAVLSSLVLERASLSLLEAQYRDRWAPSLDEIADGLEPHVTGARVLAPLAGGPKPNPDHRLVRDAALALLEEGVIAELAFYADVPYCVKLGGWPAAWGGTHPDPAWLGRALREARYIGAWWTGRWIELDAPERAAKLSAMRGYVTQFENLDKKLRTRGLVSNPAIYGTELYWPAERLVR